MSEPSRIERRLNAAGMGCLNFWILFVVVNLAVGWFLNHADQTRKALQRGVKAYQPHRLHLRFPAVMGYIDEDGYEDVDTKDVEGMLDEMSEKQPTRFVYESWVAFRPEPFTGKYVNNLFLGDPEFTYRKSLSPYSSPAPAGTRTIDVYLFGGSTAYGYNAADAWTLGTCLWEVLSKKVPPDTRINLVNFGRPVYYSSQEAQLFRRLLEAGHVPGVAIFLDGLNDVITMAHRTDKTTFDPLIAKAVYEAQYGKPHDLQAWQWVPLVRLAYLIREKAHPAPPPPIDAPVDVGPASQFVLQHYRDNRATIQDLAKRYGVQCYFFWQPVPYYHYDRTLSLRYPDNAPVYEDLYHRCYDLMRDDQVTMWLGDALQQYGPTKHVFVDPVHYNLPFTRYLAGRMAEKLDGLQSARPVSKLGARHD